MRGLLGSIGLVPILFIAGGLVIGRRRLGSPLVLIGILWASWNLLYAYRQVNATVTADDPTITYHAAED